MKFRLRLVRTSKLLLDPNNYRFLDSPDWKRRQRSRFHEDSVQGSTLRRLEHTHKYQLAQLRQSILANGYVPLERVVVIPYEHVDGLYLVVEGNRRVAALKTLLRDHEDGSLTLSRDQIANFSKISVAILEEEGEDLIRSERVIMGIRHIGGPQEWGAYQQAHFILELHDEESQDFTTIAEHLGLKMRETARRYRAMRALKEMEVDEIYSEAANTEYYRLFHELVANPDVREYFSWNHDDAAFEDEEKARQFFELIAPQEPEVPAKIKTYLDVRGLRNIIGIRSAESALFDPDESLAAALQKAGAEDAISRSTANITNDIRQFREALANLNIDALRALSEQEIADLQELIELISTRLEDYAALTRQ